MWSHEVPNEVRFNFITGREASSRCSPLWSTLHWYVFCYETIYTHHLNPFSLPALCFHSFPPGNKEHCGRRAELISQLDGVPNTVTECVMFSLTSVRLFLASLSIINTRDVKWEQDLVMNAVEPAVCLWPIALICPTEWISPLCRKK